MTHVVHDLLISRVIKNMKLSRDTNLLCVIIETGIGQSGSEWVREARSRWRVGESGSEGVRVTWSG